MIEKPSHFDECFCGKVQEDRNFLSYMNLVTGASSPIPMKSRPEKHHIVPREWLSWNVPGFSAATEDQRNVVYMTVRDRLLALQRLVLVFLEKGDSRTYRDLVGTVSRRYHIPRAQFWSNPYLERDTIGALVERREAEISGRKRKYTDEYLKRCLSVWNSCRDKNAAFARIRAELGFRHSMRALVAAMSERFGEGAVGA